VRFRLLVLVTGAALVAVGATEATATTMAVPKLDGTIGPGFTISLKNAHGKKVSDAQAREVHLRRPRQGEHSQLHAHRAGDQE
jgi:hypothetical protein